MATKTVSIVTGGSNLAPTTAAEINAVATDFISSGVVGSVSLNTGSGGTGSFAVNAQASPGMSVRVSSGQLYVSATPTGGSSQKVRVSMDTFEDVTIAANSTGGTRFDWLYAKVDPDKLLNPGANKDDVVTLVTSRSTSSSTDNGTPPTHGYNLGVITVANGASSITNSNITDQPAQTGPSAVSNTATGFIPATALGTGAITLGYAEITSSFSTSATASVVDVTGLSVTVNVPAGGRRIKISFAVPGFQSNGAPSGLNANLLIREGSTTLQTYETSFFAGSVPQFPTTVMYSTVATAGSHTYKASIQSLNAGFNVTLLAGSTLPAFILVEAI